jgi:Gamma-thionin family
MLILTISIFILITWYFCIAQLEMGPAVVEARTCESQSHKFKGSCIRESNCANVCKTEGFHGGKCRGFRRRCFCTKHCAADTIASDTTPWLTEWINWVNSHRFSHGFFCCVIRMNKVIFLLLSFVLLVELLDPIAWIRNLLILYYVSIRWGVILLAMRNCKLIRIS